MKPHSIKSAASIAATALALATAIVQAHANQDKTQSQDQSPTVETSAHVPSSTRGQEISQSAQASVRIASETDANHLVDKLSGQEVLGASREKVGTLKDFLIDAQNGKVVFGVVSSGGFAGIGDTLRLVPYDALHTDGTGSEKRAGFTTHVQKANWNKLPAIDEQDFEAGRITITAAQQQEAAAAASTGGSAMTTASSERDRTGDFNGRMVRASDIEGKSVRSGTETIGEVEGVVIDFDRGTAAALIEADAEFAGSEQRFLVPLERLQLSAAEQDSISTSLTRADLQGAQTESRTVTSAATSDIYRYDQQQSANATVATSDELASTTSAAQRTDADVVVRTGIESDQPLSATGSTDYQRDQSTTVSSAADSQSSDKKSQNVSNETVASGSIQATDDAQLTPTGRVDAPDTSSTSGSSATGNASYSQSQSGHTGSATNDARQEQTSASERDDNQFNAQSATSSVERSNTDANANVDVNANAGAAGTAGVTASTANTSTDEQLTPTGRIEASTSTATGTDVSSTASSSGYEQSTAGTAIDNNPTVGVGTTAAGTQTTTNDRDESNVRVDVTSDATNEPLSATGRTEITATNEATAGIDPTLQSAARAVRQIWQAHPELAKLNLQVTPGDGKLVFHGTVPNDDLWERAKDTAEGVITRIEIDNRIRIQNP